MLFDRQVLYLALLFASENVLAVPFSLPASDNVRVSVELQPAVSPSPVPDVVSQATKIYSLQNDSPVPSSTESGRKSGVEEPQRDQSSSSIPVASASATASPSRSFLTSPIVNELLLSFARATPSSTGPGYVNSGSPKAGDSQQHNGMALVLEVPGITARDASPAASSTGILDGIESIFNSVYSEITSAVVSDAASSTGGAITTSVSVAPASESPSPTTTNALSILFSALPSSLASPLNSELNSVFSSLLPTDQSSASTAAQTSASTTGQSSSNSADSSSQTSATHSATDKTTHLSPINNPTRRPTSHHTTTHHTIPTHTTRPTTFHTSTSSTSTTGTSTNSMSQAEQTGGANDSPSIGSHPISNASIAGIVSGLGAGFVVAGLAGLYLFRRKKQGKAMFGGLGRGGSKRSTGSGPYPAVAWLYDPKISPAGSPPRSRSGSINDGAEERLIPEPRPGSVEMAGSAAPNLGPARPSSPLLAPHMPPERDRSPSPSRSRGSRDVSSDGSQSLLRPIREE